MDLMAPLNYVYAHPTPVTGGLIVLICVTAIVLLIRGLREKGETTGTTTVEAKIDVDTIEGAMKRVLASQPAPVAASPAPVVFDGADSEAMNAALREREARISELQSEIAKLRADLENMKSTSVSSEGAVQAAGDPGQISELEEKIEELKGRLQEYEIIEDDIADLSLYKDENLRLKHEIKRLRDEFPEAATAVPTAEQQETQKEVDAAEAAIATEVAPAPEAPAEDDVMKQFAAAVQVQKAPPPEADLKVETNPFSSVAAVDESEETAADPFAFELDPDKIMNEVSTLSGSDDSGSALEETLDTDKLLAEVGSLNVEAPATSSAAAPAQVSAPQPTPAPAAAPAPAPAAPETKSFDPMGLDTPAVDDLLAEFKETKS